MTTGAPPNITLFLEMSIEAPDSQAAEEAVDRMADALPEGLVLRVHTAYLAENDEAPDHSETTNP